MNKEDAQSLKDNAENKAKKYMDLSEEEMSKIAKEVGKNIGNNIEKTQEHLYQAKDKCEEAVKTYPLASVGLAFGIGLIVGWLLKNR